VKSFQSEDRYYIRGRGWVYVVKLTEDIVSPNDYFLGQLLEIDGQPMHCWGVERFCHSPP
jgi:hypothetical protein